MKKIAPAVLVTPTLFLAAALWSTSCACAQDEVIEKATGDGEGRRHNGQIIDYTGRELILRTPSTGRERAIPADRVEKIVTRYLPGHRRARQLFAAGPAEEGKYTAAMAGLRAAYTAEPRKWVKRMLLAEMTRCLHAMGQTGKAGEVFEMLLKTDPQTLYFNAIPLVWEPVQPSTTTATQAQNWLRAGSTPTAQLMAASWLLASVDHRNNARATLAALKNSRDIRVAHLAGAQLWRYETATAKAADVQRWKEQLAQMPADIQSGPYFVLGRALALQKQHEPAALAFMRPVVLAPANHTLLAPALRGAARSLEKLGRRDEAISLYREIAVQHKLSPYAGEASSRIANLQK